MKAMRIGILSLTCLLFCHFGNAQSVPTTPGGVSSGLILWLDANDINANNSNPTSGSHFTTWKDKSGSANNALSMGTTQPTFKTGMINGLPSVTFTRLNSANSTLNGTGFYVPGVDIRAATHPQVTIFTVYRQSPNYANQQQAVWGDDNADWDRFFFTKFSNPGAGANDGGVSFGPNQATTVAIVRNAGTPGLVQLLTAAYIGSVSGSVNVGPAGGSAIYFNGQPVTTFTDQTDPTDAQTSLRIGLDGDDNYFDGEIAEMIVYERQLTACEIQAVNQYLSSKYGQGYDVAASYSYTTPALDIKGVGNFGTNCVTDVITSASSNILTISNPANTALNNNLTFANNGGGFSVSRDVPSGYTARISQLWRADAVGNVGTVDVSFDLTGLGLSLTDADNFALLTSSATSFTSGTAITTGRSLSGNIVTFSGVTLTKGQYFTLAILATTPVAAITGITDDTGISSTDFLTNDRHLVLSGTADPNSTVVLRHNGAVIATFAAGSDGTWSYDNTAATLVDGGHLYSVTASVNGVSGTTSSVTVTIDGTPPAAPAPVISNISNGYENTGTLTVTGTAEANSTVTVYDNGTVVGTAIADASGNWSYPFSPALTDGQHVISATATDAAGNTGPAGAAPSFIVDTTPPAAPSAPVVPNLNNGYAKTNVQTATGTAEAGSTVTVYDNGTIVGTATADASGNWSYPFSPALTDGLHTLSATATDAAGNISPAGGTTSFIVDTTPPAAPSAPVISNEKDGYVNTGTPVATGTAEAGSTVTVYDNGIAVGTATADANGNWSYTFSPALTEGQHAVSATATDAAGNTSPTGAATSFIVDTTPLSVTLSTDNQSVNTPFTVTITFSKPVNGFDISTMTVTDCTLSGLAKVNDSVYTVLVTPISEGNVSLSLPAGVVTDKAGNSNEASNNLTIQASSTVGIDRIYPVPAPKLLNIHFTGVAPEEGRVILIDMAGQHVYDQVTSLRGQLLTINVAGLASGIYILKVQAKDYQYHTKVIIGH